MMKFIYFCMAILVGSFIAVPVFTGVSDEHQALMASVAPATNATQTDNTLNDVYEIAREGSDNFSPEDLNNITPAAGADTPIDSFSMGFSGIEDSALTEEKAAIIAAPESSAE